MKIILDNAHMFYVCSRILLHLGVQIMTVISMAQVRCPRSGGKTCLPLLGALATGAPAL